jgi:menaquinone-dependent protoporphyrinogen oxidase
METLIVYATKHGCTASCARVLADKLADKADLFQLGQGRDIDLDSYGKVIIGGSIYAGRIQKEVSEVCLKNLAALQTKKLGLFICGMLTNMAQKQLEDAFPPALSAHAAAREFFGGEFRFGSMNFLERFLVKTIAKKDQNLSGLDLSKDVSTVSEECILRFAQRMNGV